MCSRRRASPTSRCRCWPPALTTTTSWAAWALAAQNGVIKVGSPIQVCDWHNPDVHMSGRITKLFDFKANGREPIESAQAGDIVAFAGLPDISIGNTICDPSKVQPLPFVKINDPTVEMTFSVNDSPFAGKEGSAGHLPPDP